MTNDDRQTDQFEQLLKDGFEQFYVGEWEKADELYEAARKLRPESGRPLVLEGRSRLMQGRLEEALAKFEEALEVEPDSVEAYQAFSSFYGVYGGDHVRSVEFLLYALQIDPERPRTWHLLLQELGMLRIPDMISEAAELAGPRAVGESESAYDLRCAIHCALGHEEKLREEAERFSAKYPDSKTAEVFRMMSQPAQQAEGEPIETEPEMDKESEESFAKFLECYQESFRIGSQQKQQIGLTWQSFLDRKLPRPSLL